MADFYIVIKLNNSGRSVIQIFYMVDAKRYKYYYEITANYVQNRVRDYE